jgi:hypothetical protein
VEILAATAAILSAPNAITAEIAAKGYHDSPGDGRDINEFGNSKILSKFI